MPRAAAIYARISDDRTGAGLGVARQEEDCRALAERKGWNVAQVYVDNDVSAYSGKPRPAYRRLLADIERGAIDGLLVWHLDRLHRSPRELEEFFDVTDRAALKSMATFTGDVDLSADDGRFHARILGAVARKESDDKSRRIRRKHEELARSGRRSGGGTRGYGYESDRLTIRTDEAALIQEAARRILSGESLRGVCTDWNAREIPTVTGAKWSTVVVRRILTAPGTAGLREHHGELYESEWPGVLDRETHERLKAILLNPARRKYRPGAARSYLLTGFLYCGLCGEKCVARPKADKRRCYVCASGVNFKGCGKIRQLAEPLENLVSEAIFQALCSPEFSQAFHDASESDESDDLFARLRKDEQSLEQLAADHYADALITREEFMTARRALLTRVEATRNELARREQTRAFADVPSGEAALRRAWDERGLEWRRALVAAVLDRVTLAAATKGQNFFNPERVGLLWRA